MQVAKRASDFILLNSSVASMLRAYDNCIEFTIRSSSLMRLPPLSRIFLFSSNRSNNILILSLLIWSFLFMWNCWIFSFPSLFFYNYITITIHFVSYLTFSAFFLMISSICCLVSLIVFSLFVYSLLPMAWMSTDL